MAASGCSHTWAAEAGGMASDAGGLRDALAVLKDYCADPANVDVLAAKEACDYFRSYLARQMKLQGIREAGKSRDADLRGEEAEEQAQNDYGQDQDRAALSSFPEGRKRRIDDDNPHKFKVVSVRACLVCGGPRGTDDGSDGHCQSCYTALWRDAKRVVERGVKQKRSISLTGDRKLDLELFTKEAASVGKACNTYDCGPEKYHHSLSEQNRCTRCRTKAAIRLLPELSHRLLEKSCAALLKDTQRKAALYGMLNCTNSERRQESLQGPARDLPPENLSRSTSQSQPQTPTTPSPPRQITPLVHNPQTTAYSTFPAVTGTGHMTQPMQVMFNPYTGQYVHPAYPSQPNNGYYFQYGSTFANPMLTSHTLNPQMIPAQNMSALDSQPEVSKQLKRDQHEYMKEALAPQLKGSN